MNSNVTEERINAVIANMPGGMDGFLKTWGLHDFARAVVEHFTPTVAQPSPDLIDPMDRS